MKKYLWIHFIKHYRQVIISEGVRTSLHLSEGPEPLEASSGDWAELLAQDSADKQSEDTVTCDGVERQEGKDLTKTKRKEGRPVCQFWKGLIPAPWFHPILSVYKYAHANQRKCVMENMRDKCETWGRSEECHGDYMAGEGGGEALNDPGELRCYTTQLSMKSYTSVYCSLICIHFTSPPRL